MPREVVGPAPVHNQVWFVPLTGLSALGADLARRKRNCTKTKPLAWKLLLENPAVGEQRSHTSTRFQTLSTRLRESLREGERGHRLVVASGVLGERWDSALEGFFHFLMYL